MSVKVTCKEKKEHMKPRQYGQLLIVLVLFVAACSNESSAVSVRRTSTPTRQATPTSTQVVHVAQQPLPKGLLNSAYPVMDWAVDGGYTGVIIDFELVNGKYPNIRTKFATFMQELQDALHQKGLRCGIALIHKISDRPEEDPSFQGNFFEDWRLLSRLDFLVVMTVDLDLSLGKPGPLVSIDWVEKQLDYLWQTIPQALSKTIFEFPLYGRSWQQDAQGKWHPLADETCPQVNAEKDAHPSSSQVNTDATTPELAWTDESGSHHELWYNTASSLVGIMTQLQEKARGLLNNPDYRLPTSFW